MLVKSNSLSWFSPLTSREKKTHLLFLVVVPQPMPGTGFLSIKYTVTCKASPVRLEKWWIGRVAGRWGRWQIMRLFGPSDLEMIFNQVQPGKPRPRCHQHVINNSLSQASHVWCDFIEHKFNWPEKEAHLFAKSCALLSKSTFLVSFHRWGFSQTRSQDGS